MSIIISKKNNMLLINFQELDNIKTTRCLLNSLTLIWWWWWCKMPDLWECHSEWEWDRWDLIWEDIMDLKIIFQKEEIIKELIIKIELLTKIKLNLNNKLKNKPLQFKMLVLKKWQFKVLKIILVNSLKWKKKDKVLYWENYSILWLENLPRSKIFLLKLQEC